MQSQLIGALLLLGLSAVPCAAAPSLADIAEKHDAAGVRALLAGGADVNAAQVDGTTALHWAAFHNDAELVGMLLRAGANANAANLYGTPPL